MVQYLSSEAAGTLTSAQLQNNLGNSEDIFSDRNLYAEKISVTGNNNLLEHSEFSSFLPNVANEKNLSETDSESSKNLNVSRETTSKKINNLSEDSPKNIQTASVIENIEKKLSSQLQKTDKEVDPELSGLIQTKIRSHCDISSEKNSVSSSLSLMNLTTKKGKSLETEKITGEIKTSVTEAKKYDQEEKEAFSPALPPVLLATLTPLERAKIDIKVHLPRENKDIYVEDSLSTSGKRKKAGIFTSKTSMEKLQKTVAEIEDTSTAIQEQTTFSAVPLSKDSTTDKITDNDPIELLNSINTSSLKNIASVSKDTSQPSAYTSVYPPEEKNSPNISSQDTLLLSLEKPVTTSKETSKTAESFSTATSSVFLNPAMFAENNNIRFSAKLNLTSNSNTYSISAKTIKPTVQLGSALVSFISEKGSSEKTLILQLHPLNLGKIKIEIIGKEGENLTVRVNAENENTLNLLSRDQNEIANILQQAKVLSSDNEVRFSFTSTPITQNLLLEKTPLLPTIQPQTSGFSLQQNNGNLTSSFANKGQSGQQGQNRHEQSSEQQAVYNRNLTVNINLSKTSTATQILSTTLIGKKTRVNITV